MIIITGPSGAGKSSQAALLANSQPDFVHVEIGEALRQSQDPQVQQLLGAGELVDDSLVAEIIEAAIKNVPDGKEVVLDGFPRRLSQVVWLDSVLDKLDVKLRKVVVLEVDRPTIAQRLGRRGRQDDITPIIQKKWDVYQQQTQEVINHYDQLGLVGRVDGRGSLADVNRQILRVVNEN